MKHGSLVEALAAFQAEIPTIAKGNEAKIVTRDKGTYGYSYADLSDVTETVLPLLGKHGLAWVTVPTLDPELGFVLKCSLHYGAESIEGTYPLSPNLSAQQRGAEITYGRRYMLCAFTGVAPGGDDTDSAPPQPEVPMEPSADWEALIQSAPNVEALLGVVDRISRAREVTEELRVAYAMKRGQLEKESTGGRAGNIKQSAAAAGEGSNGAPANDAAGNGKAAVPAN